MNLKPIKVYANETQSVAWLRDDSGGSIGGKGRVLSVQVVGPGTAWTTAILTVVGRVHPNCPPVALVGVRTITSSLPYVMQIDVTAFADIGLQVTTVQGSTIELDAYAVLGG